MGCCGSSEPGVEEDRRPVLQDLDGQTHAPPVAADRAAPVARLQRAFDDADSITAADPLATSNSLASLPSELRLMILAHVAGLHSPTHGLPLPTHRLRDFCSLMRTCKAFLSACDRDAALWAQLWEAALPPPARTFLTSFSRLPSEPKSCREQFEALCAHKGATPRLGFRQLMTLWRVLSGIVRWRAIWVEGIRTQYTEHDPFTDSATIVLHTTDEEFLVSVLSRPMLGRPQLLIAPDAALTGVSKAMLDCVDLVRRTGDLNLQLPVCVHWSVLAQPRNNYVPLGSPNCKVIAVSVTATMCASTPTAPDHPLRTWSTLLNARLRPNGPYHLHPSFATALAPRAWYTPAETFGFYQVGGIGEQLSQWAGALLMHAANPASLPPAPGGGPMQGCFVYIYVTGTIQVILMLWNDRELLRPADRADGAR